MDGRTWKRLGTGILVATMAACGTSSVVSEGSPPVSTSSTLVVLSDAAEIWCDENRWRVVARAEQLDLPIPSETNPAEEVGAAEAQEELDRIRAASELGDISNEEARRQLAEIREKLEAGIENYESGIWHVSGVRDEPWDAYRSDQQAAYVRACQAAFDLRDGN